VLHQTGCDSHHGQVDDVDRHREWRIGSVLAHQLAGERNQDDEGEIEQGEHHQAAVVLDDRAHEAVAADPVQADHHEADRECGEVRTFGPESFPQARVRRYVRWNIDLEDEQGDRDRKHAVGESKDPRHVFSAFKPGQILLFIHKAILPTGPDDLEYFAFPSLRCENGDPWKLSPLHPCRAFPAAPATGSCRLKGAEVLSVRFPEVEGKSLDGRVLQLPADLEGEINLVAVAFHRSHQAEVDTWKEVFSSLENEYEGLVTYEVPTISGRWKPMRPLIDGGMTAAIPDPVTRSRTVTVYGDTRKLTGPLELETTDRIAVVLTDRQGRISWIARGACPGPEPEGLAEALDIEWSKKA